MLASLENTATRLFWNSISRCVHRRCSSRGRVWEGVPRRIPSTSPPPGKSTPSPGAQHAGGALRKVRWSDVALFARTRRDTTAVVFPTEISVSRLRVRKRVRSDSPHSPPTLPRVPRAGRAVSRHWVVRRGRLRRARAASGRRRHRAFPPSAAVSVDGGPHARAACGRLGGSLAARAS